MKKQHRHLTEKYKTLRLRPDSLYSSRILQTFFNKFTKKGKKTLARRHTLLALIAVRYTLRRPKVFNFLIQILQTLRTQFILLPRRKGNVILNVPVPTNRNKRDTISIHRVYKGVLARKHTSLTKSIEDELLSITLGQTTSVTFKNLLVDKRSIFEERVNMDFR